MFANSSSLPLSKAKETEIPVAVFGSCNSQLPVIAATPGTCPTFKFIGIPGAAL